MKINKIRGVYFSGTGGTAKAVVTLTQKLAELFEIESELVCFNPPAARKSIIECDENMLVVVGLPVYADRLPNKLLPFLEKNVIGHNTLAIPLCTYGNRSVGDGLMELRNILQGNGFCCIGAAAVVAQHTFAPRLGFARPSGPDFLKLKLLAREMKEKIDNMTQVPTEAVEVIGNNPVGPYYIPHDRYGYPIDIVKVRPKTKPSCVKCGLCIKLCPVGAISPDPKQIPGPCIKCGACIKHCPKHAKYYDDPGMLLHSKELDAQFREPKETEIFF